MDDKTTELYQSLVSRKETLVDRLVFALAVLLVSGLFLSIPIMKWVNGDLETVEMPMVVIFCAMALIASFSPLLPKYKGLTLFQGLFIPLGFIGFLYTLFMSVFLLFVS